MHDSLKLKPERTMLMKKTYGVAIVAVLMGAALNAAAAGPTPTGIKNVVLVHGAFADGSGWDAVAKILEKDGYTVSVAQPPETSYADDQKYTKAAIDAMGGRGVQIGSGWDAVAKILEKDGYTVSVAQPPETSYADDQKYTKAAIDAMGGRVVLVGHSYG